MEQFFPYQERSKETSQLAGKTNEDSDYTVVIAIMH